MPIDVAKVVGASLGESEATWDEDNVILYNLGLGVGVPPTDERELAYTYEANLQAVPSFGVWPALGLLDALSAVDGLVFDPRMLLHGEQDLVLHRPLPTSAKVRTRAQVAAVHDKGKAALVVVEAETSEIGGDALCTNRFSLFIRGEGGFGGTSGPEPAQLPPERPCDMVVETTTMPQLALLYRLSGDKNPLHADPEYAKAAGFDRPILHGLCSFGIVCKAVVDHALGGDVARVARYQTRFAGVVFPGETLVTSLWREPGTILISVTCKERNTPVITNAAITLAG